jgi:hypothetical protein
MAIDISCPHDEASWTDLAEVAVLAVFNQMVTCPQKNI